MTEKNIQQRMPTSTRLNLSRHRGKNLSYTVKYLLLFFFQAVLALLIYSVNQAATLHAYITMAVGAFLVFTEKESDHLIDWMGYIAGVEILWRGMDANVFWETGKYAIILISLLGFVKGYGKLKPNYVLIFYFVLLIPAVLIMPSFDREAIASILAGPLAMVAASLFFSRQVINIARLKSFLLIILSSVLTFSILVLVGVINAETLEFGVSSNFATSANTGPNQVSSILAFGAFAAFIYAFIERENKFLRFIVLMLAVGLLVQTALTFSRGGLYTLVGALLAGGFFFMRDRKTRTTYVAVALITALVFAYLILPLLDTWTSGAMSARLRDTEPTGRLDLINSDWQLFLQDPLLGVGVGQSNYLRVPYYRESNAHTEYSRMLAEHGMFGVIALLILVMAVIVMVLRKDRPLNKAFYVACLTWGLLFMAHSATRLVAPMFLIGLSFAKYDLTIEKKDSTDTDLYRRYQRRNLRIKTRLS